MINSMFRKPAGVLLIVCALTLTACAGAGQRTSIPGSGPPASQEAVTRSLSGKSALNNGGGATFYAPDGTYKSFHFDTDGPNVCIGTWRVDGSTFEISTNCTYRNEGKIVTTPELTRGQIRNSAYYWDLVVPGSVIQISKRMFAEGFPREAEFNELSRQLGL